MEQTTSSQEVSIEDLFATPAATPTVESQAPPVVDPAQAAVVEPVPAPQPPPTPTVPLPELLEQRHARQLAEQKAQFAEQRLAEYQRAIEAQYRQQQPQPQPIDPVGDPEGFARAVAQENANLRRELQNIATNMPANITEYLVRDKFGDEAVNQAVEEAKKAGLGPHFMKQPNPYKSLMEWKTNQTVAQQVGPDLNAYREKVRQEIIAEMKAGRPAPQNLPPSLASATNAGRASPMVPDASETFAQMFAKRTR